MQILKDLILIFCDNGNGLSEQQTKSAQASKFKVFL